MNIKLVEATGKDQIEKIYELYMNAFPKSERKPFSIIIKKQKEGTVDILSIENENNEFVGEAITAKYKDLVLLDYFAIDPEKRSSGYGSLALALLQEKYNNKRFILEIERDDIDCENKEQRIKRKKFYLKNSMQLMDYNVCLFNEEMNILTYKCHVSFEEYYSIYLNVFGEKTAKNVWLLD